jgi:hypothetical protein
LASAGRLDVRGRLGLDAQLHRHHPRD